MSNEMFGGVVDDSPQGGNYKFGLMPKVKLTKFGYNTAIKAGDKTYEGIEMEFEIGNQPYKSTIFPPSKTDATGKEFTKEEYNKSKDKTLQKLFHISKCFATTADITAAVAIPVASFQVYVEKLISAWESDWQEKELDLFFQYQWQMKEGSDKKYLEIPKDTKQGAFLLPHTEGNFSRVDISAEGVATVNGDKVGELQGKILTLTSGKEFKFAQKEMALVYIDLDSEIIHPFQRSKWFMENGWGCADDGSSAALNSWA